MMKEDAALRKRLGDNGRENVKDLSCKNVVLEMLDWYRQGMRNMKSRGLLSKVALMVPLLAAIPFCIVALFCYDTVTWIMVCLFGMKLDLGANDEKIKSKKE